MTLGQWKKLFLDLLSHKPRPMPEDLMLNEVEYMSILKDAA